MNLEKEMYRSGLDNVLSLLIGMRGPLDNPGKGKWYGPLYTAYVAYLDFCVLVSFITMVWWIFTVEIDVGKMCYTSFPTGSMIFSFTRRIDMYMKKPRYKKLMEGYLSLYGDSPELNADVNRYSKIIRNVPRILQLFTAMPMGLMNFAPIIIALRGGPRVFCVSVVFPFEPTANLFLFCYLNVLLTTCALLTTLRPLLFENTFNMFVCRHLALIKHLSRDLSRILSIIHVDNRGTVTFLSDDGKLMSKEQARRKVLTELKQWVKNHQQSARLAIELQDIYSFPMFLQYAFTGVMLCTSAFVVANNERGPVNVIFIGLFAIGLSISLLITCRFGDLILYESNSMERTIEGNCISSMPGDIYKQYVRMILIKARVPSTLSALGVFPLDIETFKSFMLTTYSFFTLLKTMKH